MFETILQEMTQELTQTFSVVPAPVAFVRLLAASVLAALIGAEREMLGKPAGLRTHILVAVAATCAGSPARSSGRRPRSRTTV